MYSLQLIYFKKSNRNLQLTFFGDLFSIISLVRRQILIVILIKELIDLSQKIKYSSQT